eukprot:2608538-Pyramimonas_sp.AAC.1
MAEPLTPNARFSRSVAPADGPDIHVDIARRLRGEGLTHLASVTLEDDPCVCYSLNADPDGAESEANMHHFISMEGARARAP